MGVKSLSYFQSVYSLLSIDDNLSNVSKKQMINLQVNASQKSIKMADKISANAIN